MISAHVVQVPEGKGCMRAECLPEGSGAGSSGGLQEKQHFRVSVLMARHLSAGNP